MSWLIAAPRYLSLVAHALACRVHTRVNAVVNYTSRFLKFTDRLTTSNPSARCARCDPMFSISVSDAISLHPCRRAQSSAWARSAVPMPSRRNGSVTNQPSTYPTGHDSLQQSACERSRTSRNPTIAPPATAISTVSGNVSGIRRARINSNSRACSSAEDSGQSVARNRASSMQSGGSAMRIKMSPT